MSGGVEVGGSCVVVVACCLDGGVVLLGPAFDRPHQLAEHSPATATIFVPVTRYWACRCSHARPGHSAELVAPPARHFVAKPDGLSHQQAAALPLVGLTAWQALVDTARVDAGQRVLVHGGGGGVGHVAVQIAMARGAHVVATASRPKHEWLRSLGVDQTIDHRGEDFIALVSDVDVVFDTVGGGVGQRSLDVLRRGGLLVTIVDHFDQNLAAAATEWGVRMAGVAVEPDRTGLEALVGLVERGLLRPHVQEVFPLEAIADAHRAVSAGSVTGKIVVSVRP